MKNEIILKKKYLSSDAPILTVLDFIKNTDFDKMSDGRLNITDTIWANLQTYETKQEALFEAHRDYIDLQYLISGQEKIGVVSYSKCKTEIEYDKDKDIEFLNSLEGEYIEMSSGHFLILYPDDAHKPSISIEQPLTVRKLVAKIPVER